MKEQLNEGRDNLINNIQQHLQILRDQRRNIENKKNQYRQQQTKNNDRTYQTGSIPLNAKQKQQIRMKTQQLGQLYAAKKQLSGIGISAHNLHQIYKYKTDPKMMKVVEQKRQKKQKQLEHKKIIEEQLINTKKLLDSKNIKNKQVQQLQMMNYRILLKEKINQLRNYQTLLKKYKLSRVEKEQLINITFQLICDWNRIVNKKYVREYLIANPQFCQKFHITSAEINRDLQVYETKQQGYLDQLELYEFVKSIQITSSAMKPSLKLKKPQKPKKIDLNDGIDITQKILQQQTDPILKLKNRQNYKKYIQYFRKLFKHLDRFSEGVIQRQSYLAHLQKKWNITKENNSINSDILAKFVEFVKKQTIRNRHSSFYKELESKFISFNNIQVLFKAFAKAEGKDQNQTIKQQQSVCTLQNYQDNHIKQEYPKYSQKQRQIEYLQKDNQKLNDKDYQKYGWDHKQNTDSMRLADLDRYYLQMNDKYMTEIAWNNNVTKNNYKADFKQLQAFIKQHEKQLKSEK